nr:class I SAM-dependent methyltransferase [Acidobacteriota bacterium]NIM64094.1 class I SAM-dependent methyltransferase [Acidobacteriota bacterium]NIO59394.1 class I SAM-dependent methyltransferase [Acidobacteriota bacterium]NIQ30428.1 class I SAM-dependent methyltransferase [Acidobacteriota bacterium]NIQ85360.1 class I SAM-dependent methyltransferase [Acidobacteriota bacterium]
MNDDLTRFDGSIPENYDRGLGPVIFSDFGADLSRRVGALNPRSVLELASGTGIVTRVLRDAVDANCELVATDLSEEMLVLARSKFDAGERVSFRPADAMELPFEDRSFDAVCCQFGVMFFPDKEQSYREALRVLKPGGRYVFNVWCALEHNPFAQIAYDAAASFFSENPPQFYLLPFSYHDVEEVTGALARAGFADVRGETIRLDKAVQDYEKFAHGLVFGNPIAEEIRRRGGVDAETVKAAIAEALRTEF